MTSAAGDPLRSWRDALATWAIPEEIVAGAPESPWQLPREPFARRADAQIEERRGRALRRAEEALAPGGTLLDVGAGGGAASLPLAGLIASLVAVDADPGMLEELRERADRLGVPVTPIAGCWPDVAEQAPVCDVVVCGHVLYNVPELAPFLEALTDHARRRVVVELTARHPASTLNPLWLRFHGLERPDRPTWEDAARAISALGLDARVEREQGPGQRPSTGSFAELVAWTRRRLCLPPERDPEVAGALRELGIDPGDPTTWGLRPTQTVVLWWDRR